MTQVTSIKPFETVARLPAKTQRVFGGVFLCDDVGIGKTFARLMLIERMVLF